MTIESEVSYLGGYIYRDREILPEGTTLFDRSRSPVSSIFVKDPDTLVFTMDVGDESIESTLFQDEINEAGYQIGPSNIYEMLLGRSVTLYWEKDSISRALTNDEVARFALRRQFGTA